VATGTG